MQPWGTEHCRSAADDQWSSPKEKGGLPAAFLLVDAGLIDPEVVTTQSSEVGLRDQALPFSFAIDSTSFTYAPA